MKFHMISKYGTFNPYRIIADLLKLDLGSIVPIAQCFYLWSVGEILRTVPYDTTLGVALDAAVEQCSCGKMLTQVPIAPELLSIPMGVHGSTEIGIKGLIGEYAARPPTRHEIVYNLIRAT